MDYEEYKQYASDAAQAAESNFSLYKAKVAGFALLGYLVIFGLLTILLALFGGLAASAFVSTAMLLFLVKSKLIFVLLPMIWVMARALWVKLEPPSGYELTRDRFPQLFAELDALSTTLDSLKIHQVILTPEMNAAIVQSPRLGMFGWQKNTLILGLELLLTLSCEQARSVVAHELGHLSGNHSRFHGWIYRVRESWSRLVGGLREQENFGSENSQTFEQIHSRKFKPPRRHQHAA